MIGCFEYNGVKSSEFKLVCKSVNRPLLPGIRQRKAEIYGKSGIIDYGGGDYTPKKITMRISYVGTSYTELRTRARDIAAWLSTNQWARLIINDEPDKFYFARVINTIDPDTIKRMNRINVIFECQPFAYMVVNTGADLTWDEADFPWITEIPWDMVGSYRFNATGETSFAFNNPGTKTIYNESPQGSQANIIVSGSWSSLTLSMNGKELQFANAASGELIIDNVEMESTLDGVNYLDSTGGDIDSFLSIVPGENIINASGTGLNITVTLDFVPMWL